MTPSRILVVHNRYRHRGGEDVVVDDEVRLLRDHGHDVEIYGRDNASIDEMTKLSLARDTVWSTRTTDELHRHLDSFAPDIIHVHNSFPLVSPSLFWAAAQRGCPVVQTLHNFRLLCLQAMFLRENRVCEDCKGKVPWRGVVRGCYHGSPVQSAVLAGMLMVHRAIGTWDRKVTRYIALNEFSRQKFIEGGLPADRITIKPNFVQPQPEHNLARAGGLFVGRLSAEKGLAMLGAALDRLPGVQIDVLGDGPELALAQAHGQLNSLGRRDRDEVLQKMHAAAYLVMPSMWYETFGLVQMEAFACGLPVIAPRLGSMEEMIEHHRTGLLFDPGSAQDLATHIRWAEDHPDDMREMGHNARSVYRARYTPDRNYLQLMEIYCNAVSELKLAMS